jgi:hypothetical protein
MADPGHQERQTTESGDRQLMTPSIFQRIFSTGPQGVMQSAGMIFSLAAAVAFFYAIFYLIGSSFRTGVTEREEILFVRDIVLPYFGVIVIIFIGVVCSFIAIRLFSKAGSLTSQVIRAEDRRLLEPLISEAKNDAINEYIRLASLSGFSGTFTKLGFTGLPLATVVLTLILLGISISPVGDDLQKGVFDMAKLTLGAFLGSFVQRNIEQERLVRSQEGVGQRVDLKPGGQSPA